MLEGSGYQPKRNFYEMLRPTLDDIPEFRCPAGWRSVASYQTIIRPFGKRWMKPARTNGVIKNQLRMIIRNGWQALVSRPTCGRWPGISPPIRLLDMY